MSTFFVGTNSGFLRYGMSRQTLTGEIDGAWHVVRLTHSTPDVNGRIKPDQITHGPQKKGRGGKPKRW